MELILVGLSFTIIFFVFALIVVCSSVVSSMDERDDELPTTTAVAFTMSNSQSLSRRTRLMKGDNHGFVDGSYRPGSVDGGYVSFFYVLYLHFLCSSPSTSYIL